MTIYKQAVKHSMLFTTVWKYKNPVNIRESELRFMMIEDNGDRAIYELINTDMTIKPQECVARNEMVLA